MTEQELRDLLAAGETLTVECKSDQRPLSDAALLEIVVCLANADGGTLLLGVEDDKTVTGVDDPDDKPESDASIARLTM